MKYTLLLTLAILVGCSKPKTSVDILVNHVGYDVEGPKKVVLQSEQIIKSREFGIMSVKGNEVFKGIFSKGGKVDEWQVGHVYSGDFSSITNEGEYFVQYETGGNVYNSDTFAIGHNHARAQCLPLLLQGLNSMRCIGAYDEKDREVPFFGDREGTMDLRGGWYDASGERGKYLSHLGFSNYLAPQQTPMFVWHMLETLDRVGDDSLKDALRDEITFGADFLKRMQDPEGYFYTTIFANWSWDIDQREISSYVGQSGDKNDEYQASFREGGGMAIAALARASRAGIVGEFGAEELLSAAEKGFGHLVENNLSYVDDGKENIIDDYCALMASIELFKSTKNEDYLVHARNRVDRLNSKLIQDDKYGIWWSADDKGKRPYYHGAEAGMPIVALSHYTDIETDESLIEQVKSTLSMAVELELNLTNEVHNPFGYGRQFVSSAEGANKRKSFFIPHDNETGYWWQGENARLASLAAAMKLAQPFLSEDQRLKTSRYVQDQLDWILGLNPYNACMLQGVGKNNPLYDEGHGQLNIDGCVANGITAGMDSDSQIAFMPLPYNDDFSHKWRWGEQWTLHGTWLMYALVL